MYFPCTDCPNVIQNLSSFQKPMQFEMLLHKAAVLKQTKKDVIYFKKGEEKSVGI